MLKLKGQVKKGENHGIFLGLLILVLAYHCIIKRWTLCRNAYGIARQTYTHMYSHLETNIKADNSKYKGFWGWSLIS